MEKWYKNLKWRNLVDMHIPDWNDTFMSRFDPIEYANMMETAGVQVSEFYTGNCLGICFFPTKAGHMHKGIKGKDITAMTLDEIGKKGIARVAYFNIWSRWAFDEHPEWRIINAKGHHTLQDENGREVSRFGQCCINNQGYRDYVKAQIAQITTDYDVKGLWIDMLGWFGHICHCEACREKYLRETGRQIPAVKDWTDPEWMQFQRFRERSMVEMASMIRNTAKEIKPEITVVFNCASWRKNYTGGMAEEFLALNDYMAGDFYGGPLMYSSICKALNNLTENRPIEFMTSRCVYLEDHTTVKSIEELRNSLHASLAHNTAFLLIDAINPDGTMNPKIYEKVGNLKKEADRFYRHWNPDAEMVADFAFYYNLKSSFDARNGESHYAKEGDFLMERICTASSTMIEAHLPYDLIFKKNLKQAIKEKKVIILSDVFILDEEEISLFTEFVENGGNLIVTGLTGMYDGEGGKRENFALSSVMGLDYVGETEEDFCYFSPVSGSLYDEYDDVYPMLVSCPAVKVRNNRDVKVLSTLTLPFSHSKEVYRFGSAISNPPEKKTSLPAVTVNQYKKGRVMYISSPFECDKKGAQRKVFVNHLRYMMDTPAVFEASAPPWMDVMLYDDGDGNYRLHFYASMETYTECEARDVKVTVRIPGLNRAYSLVKESELPVETADESITVTIDVIRDFDMVLLKK